MRVVCGAKLQQVAGIQEVCGGEGLDRRGIGAV